MFTSEDFNGLAMADKLARTQTIANLYRTFYESLPDQLKPSYSIFNTEQIFFNVFKSGLTFETANDPNAGRAGTRKFAHLSEHAFYRYALEIDEGVQNSIPLGSDTYIIKESTANGKAGNGKAFYDLWQLAKRGESIYKSFFVAWYEIDDYAIPIRDKFKLTKEEIDLIKRFPSITEENINWRRLKLLEYKSDDNSILSPEERFNQDFPIDDITAFLSTGQPIFDLEQLEKQIELINLSPMRNIKDILSIPNDFIKRFSNNLEIYSPPRKDRKYLLGADISEGLAQGDASCITVIDHEYNQVLSWYGKIDPDLLGILIVGIAEWFNQALVIPEVNNMGHTTLTAIKNEGYSHVYRETIEDKVTKEKTTKLGWRTTEKSKQSMLNHYVKLFRENDLKIKDKKLLIEMTQIARGENGNVNLNGRDRVVSMGLACMGRKNQEIIIKNKYTTAPDNIIKTMNKKKRKDIFA